VPSGDTLRLQLTHQAQNVGWLIFSARPRGRRRLSAADRRLLEDLARQIGVAARAMQLMHELQRSHFRLLQARDEERARLQRDLHDGLGPMLAGMALAAGAARNLVRSNPAEVDKLLAGLISDSRSATVDIRRLIYDLAPPALDRVGLAQALRTQVDRLSASDDPSSSEHLSVTVDASPDIVDLPADVEVAAFRIALEAFINVRRHAKARTCTIKLTLDGPLSVEVCDDGIGLPTDACLGVGLHSMEVRAAEVGGVCTVTSRDGGGTRVHALLPVPALNLLEPVQANGGPGPIARPVGTHRP
jgi:signal transduction histidine kinase